MNSMSNNLNYTSNNDQKFFAQNEHQSDKLKMKISVGTLAGRKDFNLPQKPNEDAFYVKIASDSLFAALFDGTSSLKPIASLGEESGARFASHFLMDAFQAESAGRLPEEIIRKLNRLLLEKSTSFEGADLDDVHTLPASTATILEINLAEELIRLSHVGDSFCIIYFKNKKSKFVTIDKNKAYDDQVLAMMGLIAKEKNITPREARQDPRIKKALLEMFQDSFNKPDGTGQGIINGDPNVERYIQDISFSLNEVEAIFIGSDGIVPPSYDEQKENDQKKMFEILKNGGVEKLIQITSQIEDEDPDRKFLRYKHADDATGIFIELM